MEKKIISSISSLRSLIADYQSNDIFFVSPGKRTKHGKISPKNPKDPGHQNRNEIIKATERIKLRAYFKRWMNELLYEPARNEEGREERHATPTNGYQKPHLSRESQSSDTEVEECSPATYYSDDVFDSKSE